MKTKRAAHLYVGDGIYDHKGQDRCVTCGLPKDRDVHELPPTEPDVRAVEARRVGENA